MAIYGKVESVEDIRRINCIIRDEMLEVENEAQLSELKKRSDYLCTLTYSPFWKKRFGEQIEQLRQAALEENRVTVKEANIIAKYKGFDKEYHPWRSDIDIEEQLRQIPQEVIEEITHATLSLKLDTKILEQLREEFCDIRKAMVLCEERRSVSSSSKELWISSRYCHIWRSSKHISTRGFWVLLTHSSPKRRTAR